MNKNEPFLIILNGPSSSGKTNLAKFIAENTDKLIINMLGIDLLWGVFLPKQYIMFNEKSYLGFKFTQENNKLITNTGPIGKRLSHSFVKILNLMLEEGFDLIMDDIILNYFDLAKYFPLSEKEVFLVGVDFSEKLALEREIARGDRPIGLAQSQWGTVHQYKQYYDLMIDNNNSFSYNCKLIMDYVSNNSANGLKRAKADLLKY